MACDTKSCLKTCSRLKIDRPIDFPFILEVIRDNYKTTIDKKYPSLEVDFCGFKCENPFILASSVIGHNYQMCAKALSMGWAGVSIKTLSYTKILETSPRFDVSDKFNGHFCGLKNLEQLSENSVEEDLIWIKKLKQDFPTKLLIVSIMGQNEQEWEDLARLAEASGADIIECNFSCPQMTYKGMGSDTGQDPQLVELYTKACKRGTKLPILAKLTPNLSSPDTFVNAALNGGAEGIVGINTIKSLTSVKFNKLNPGNNVKTAVTVY